MGGDYVRKCRGEVCGWPTRPGASCSGECGWAAGHDNGWQRKREKRARTRYAAEALREELAAQDAENDSDKPDAG